MNVFVNLQMEGSLNEKMNKFSNINQELNFEINNNNISNINIDLQKSHIYLPEIYISIILVMMIIYDYQL